MLQLGAAGGVVLVGLMLLVLLWQQADTLVVRFQEHCVYASDPPEAFLRVFDGASSVGYDIAQADINTTGCAVVDSGGSATFTGSTRPLTLRETEMALLATTTTAGDFRIASTTWAEPPAFVSSASQPLLSRFPRAFFGVLMLGAIAGLVAFNWLGQRELE